MQCKPVITLSSLVLPVAMFALPAGPVVQVPHEATTPIRTLPPGLSVAGIPDPSDMVVVYGGAPFEVPVGHCLVLTGITITGGNSPEIAIYFDEQVAAITEMDFNSFDEQQVHIPPGLVADPGTTIDVHPAGARALGYLYKFGEARVRLRGLPSPEEMVRVFNDEPMRVPYGHVFVATGATATIGNVDIARCQGSSLGPCARVILTVDNRDVWEFKAFDKGVRDLPIGIAAKPGQIVSVTAIEGGVVLQERGAAILGYLTQL